MKQKSWSSHLWHRNIRSIFSPKSWSCFFEIDDPTFSTLKKKTNRPRPPPPPKKKQKNSTIHSTERFVSLNNPTSCSFLPRFFHQTFHPFRTGASICRSSRALCWMLWSSSRLCIRDPWMRLGCVEFCLGAKMKKIQVPDAHERLRFFVENPHVPYKNPTISCSPGHLSSMIGVSFITERKRIGHLSSKNIQKTYSQFSVSQDPLGPFYLLLPIKWVAVSVGVDENMTHEKTGCCTHHFHPLYNINKK